MIGHLAFEHGLRDPLGQLLQQPTFAGQLQAGRTGLHDQPAHQLGVDVVCSRPAARRFLQRALTTLKVLPAGVVTDAARVYPACSTS